MAAAATQEDLEAPVEAEEMAVATAQGDLEAAAEAEEMAAAAAQELRHEGTS